MQEIRGTVTGLLPIISGGLASARGAPLWPVRLLVDTGADGVYVRESKAAEIGLESMAEWATQVPGGRYSGYAFNGFLSMPTTNGTSPIEVDVVGTVLPSLPEQCDVLLGMGVLRFCELRFSKTGSFTISI